MINSPSIVSAQVEKSNSASSENLTVSEFNGVQCVSARELYKGLKISKRFSEWFEINSKDFIENVDFTSVLTSTVVNNGAKRELQDYSISLDMAKAICLVSRTEIGRQYRQYLIELEKAWNTPEAVMARALQIADRKLADANNLIIELKPDAESWRAFAEKSGNYCVTNIARCLGISRDMIFRYLSVKGWICRDKRTNEWIGTTEGVRHGYISNEIWANKDLSGIQMRITPKGMQKIQQALKPAETTIAETAEKWIEEEGAAND